MGCTVLQLSRLQANVLGKCTKEENAVWRDDRQQVVTRKKSAKSKGEVKMRTQKMKNWKRSIVAGLAAFMMLAQSVTAFACPAETTCGCAEGEHGAAILYEEQFVDLEGNVTPVTGISTRGICFKHRIVEGYYQTHVKDGKGGCVVKTYHSTQCVICNTIWMGDLCAIDEAVKCPHNVK